MSEPLVAGMHLGRFVVTRTLGEGGMGVVYEARDPDLGRSVALKVLRAKAAEPDGIQELRLMREARILAQLAHPNVITVHEIGVAEHQVFIAMELVQGETLGDHLARGQRTRPELLDLFVQAGRGLAAAHARQIVHRDFKPSNVIVDGDGRVLVSDFGLARAADKTTPTSAPDDRSASSDVTTEADRTTAPGSPPTEITAPATVSPRPPELAAVALTAAGAVAGTPRYMAPEQRARLPLTAKSDQYAFCVALWEALFGAHPFEPDAGGRVPDVPRKAGRAPRWLVRALTTGLARDPARRHESMSELLRILERTPIRRRRATMAAAVLLVAGGGYAFAFAGRGASTRETCAPASARLAGLWNAPRGAAIDAAFAATNVPYATETARHAEAILDTYTRDWAQAGVDACRATEVHEQSEALLDLRVACLALRRQAVSALVTELGRSPDQKAVERAVAAAENLPRVADCADARQLEAAVPLPADPAARARVEYALGLVTEVGVLYQLGAYPAAKARLDDVVGAAGGLDYPALASDVARWRGTFAINGNDSKAAEAAFKESVHRAVAARDPARELTAWLELFHLVSAFPERLAEAELLRQTVEAALERVGRPPSATADYKANVVAMYIHADRAERAEAEARTLLGELPPDDRWDRANALDMDARALIILERYKDALPQAAEALKLREALLGPSHPRIAFTLNTVATPYWHLGRYDEATAALQRSLTIAEAAFGPDHPSLQNSYNELGWVAVARGDQAGVRTWTAKRLAAAERQAEIAPTRYAEALMQCGAQLARAHLYDEAEPLLRKAIDRNVAAGARGDAANAKGNLGIMFLDMHRPADALSLCIDAERELAEVHGPERDGEAAACHGNALVGLHRAREAVPILQRAVAGLEKHGDPPTLAEARFYLVTALWDADDHAGALALADRVAQDLRTIPESDELQAKVTAWRRGKAPAPATSAPPAAHL